MVELILPAVLILALLIGLVIYALMVSVRQLSKTNERLNERLAQMNEKLLIMIGAGKSDNVGRALVAHSKQPREPLKGVAKQSKNEKPKDGFMMGVR